MGCWGHAPLSPINPGKSRGFNKGRFMERQNPAAPWNNRVGSRGSLPGKPRRSPLRSFPRYSRPKIMEMAPAVPSATQFQALKTTKGSDSQRKRLSQIFILVFGPFVSPAVFSHIPGVQGGREARSKQIQGFVAEGTGMGWHEGHSKVSGKPGDPSASRAHPEPRRSGKPGFRRRKRDRGRPRTGIRSLGGFG